MSFVSIDFETYYERQKYTLKALTYEQYIFNPKFYVHGVSIKIDDGPTHYYADEAVEPKLREIFFEGNDHTVLAHNTMFDGAILSWYYKLRAKRYYCTKAMVRALWNSLPADLGTVSVFLFPGDETKRKGDALAEFAGVIRLTPEQHATMGAYCMQDTELTFAIFKELFGYFPKEELATIDNTLRMFIHPVFVTDVPLIQRFIVKQETERQALFAKSGTPMVMKNGVMTYPVLSSATQFAAHLLEKYGIEVDKIPSPTEANPDNEKFPFAKNALEFIALQEKHPELLDVWAARIRAASNIDITRATRMIGHTQANGRLAMPLQYSAAHTLRWGGTNKLNPQNLRRGSDLRKALRAPPGYKVVVRDLSNIEGRMLAWWAGETWKSKAFAEKRDLYSELATKLFGRPINRKRKAIHPETGLEYEPDFTEGFVGKTCELGLGYQMSANKLRATFMVGANGGPRMSFSADQCNDWVHTWRHTNANIANSWREAQQVVFNMANKRTEPYPWRGLIVHPGKLVLPNGLALQYSGLRLVKGCDPQFPSFEYFNGKFWTNLYGGKLVENIIQALSRIVIATQMRTIDSHLVETYKGDAGVALTVHDEIVALVPTEYAEMEYNFMGTVMATPPHWCNDGILVLASEGGIDDCYSK